MAEKGDKEIEVQTFNIPLKKNLPRARIPYNSTCFLPSLLHHRG